MEGFTDKLSILSTQLVAMNKCAEKIVAIYIGPKVAKIFIVHSLLINQSGPVSCNLIKKSNQSNFIRVACPLLPSAARPIIACYGLNILS